MRCQCYINARIMKLSVIVLLLKNHTNIGMSVLCIFLPLVN